VRLLCGLGHGSLALFALPSRAVAKAVAHRTVEELWYVIAGKGRVWRKLGVREEIVALDAGVSLSIPTDAYFQFRCDGLEGLIILGATMPPWPGADEAYAFEGVWPATV
jgi:mannose-6-phosphate isomerase-like protein (cupin superfamily)